MVGQVVLDVSDLWSWQRAITGWSNTALTRSSSLRSAFITSASVRSVACTNRREIADFDVPDAVDSTAEPTGSNPAG